MFKFKEKSSEQIRKEILIYGIAIIVLSALILLVRPVKTYADDNIFSNLAQKYVALEEGTDSEGNNVVLGLLMSDDPADYIVDEIILGTLVRIYEVGQAILDLFVKVICSTFEPTLNPLFAIESGTNITADTAIGLIDSNQTAAQRQANWTNGAVDFEHSRTLMTIWKFTFPFSIIVATLIALFNLFLCIMGKSQEIKDTPIMIGAKFLLALVLIFMSKQLATIFINFYGKVWSNLVIGGEPLMTACGDSEKWLCFQFIRRAGNIAGLGFWGMEIEFMTGGYASLIFIVLLIIGIILAIKLIKEFLKLFLEIVERYFVFFLLLAFFPCLAATVTSNTTKRIFYTYLRMIMCQGFLLIINTVFMSIFFTILSNGGWTAGLLNYLAAFAFLRVCQRADAYMAQMGFNVVQTGNSLIGAIGGSAMGFGSALHALSMADRGRQNVGKGVQQLGANTNNSGLAAMGAMMGATMGDVIGGGLSSDTLSQTIMKEQSSHISDGQNEMGSGTTSSIKAGDWDGIRSQLKDSGMSDVAAGSFINQASQQGYKPTDIGSVTQMDDKARHFAVSDANGNQFASIHGKDSDILDRNEYDASQREINGRIGEGKGEGLNEIDAERSARAKDVDEGFAAAYFKNEGVEQKLKEQEALNPYQAMSDEQIEQAAEGKANEVKEDAYKSAMDDAEWESKSADAKADFDSLSLNVNDANDRLNRDTEAYNNAVAMNDATNGQFADEVESSRQALEESTAAKEDADAEFTSKFGSNTFDKNFGADADDSTRGFSQEAYASYSANEAFETAKASNISAMRIENEKCMNPSVEYVSMPIAGDSGATQTFMKYGQQISDPVQVLDPANHSFNSNMGDKRISNKNGESRIIRSVKPKSDSERDEKAIRVRSGRTIDGKPKRK